MTMDDRRPAASLRQRWLRDGRNLLFLSLPFALATGVLALLSDREEGNYWHAMDLALFAIAAAGAWAAAVLAYLAWTLFRDGLRPVSLPALGILAAALVAGAAWETGMYDDAARCHADEAFYAALAALPQDRRGAAIAAAAPLLRRPSPCGSEAVARWFGGDPPLAAGGHVPAPQARHEVLADLLAQGLPPGDQLLYRFAAIDGDATATRLLARRRAALGMAFPADLVEVQLLPKAQPCQAGMTDDASLRARAVLRSLVAEMPDGVPALSDRSRRMLACLDLRQDSRSIATGSRAG